MAAYLNLGASCSPYAALEKHTSCSCITPSAYLVRVDSATSGSRFHASASPSLAHFLRDTAEAIPHPTDEERTLWDARFDTGTLQGDRMDIEVLAANGEAFETDDSLGVGILGTGSDYTVFLHRIGVSIFLDSQTNGLTFKLFTGRKRPSIIPAHAL